MFGKKKKMPTGKNKELDELLSRVIANAENNYKDSAQDYFRQFLALYEALKDQGKLKEKQILFYDGQRASLEKQLMHYTHIEQAPNYDGLGKPRG